MRIKRWDMWLVLAGALVLGSQVIYAACRAACPNGTTKISSTCTKPVLCSTATCSGVVTCQINGSTGTVTVPCSCH